MLMGLAKYLVFVTLIFLIGFLIEKGILKSFVGEKKKISETPGKSILRWGRGIILAVALCSLPFFNAKDINLKWYWILYFILLYVFESVIEWKYIKNSKQYVITLFYLLLIIIIFYNIDYFIN